jgi:hypothetical protein
MSRLSIKNGKDKNDMLKYYLKEKTKREK